MRYEFIKDGIFVNPTLPDEFDVTPHNERDAQMQLWWNKPYIIIEDLSPESYIEHINRIEYEVPPTKEEYAKKLQKNKEVWYEAFPEGFRYTVRCLDGGVWDRSTNHGSFATFEEALEIAKELKKRLENG